MKSRPYFLLRRVTSCRGQFHQSSGAKHICAGRHSCAPFSFTYKLCPTLTLQTTRKYAQLQPALYASHFNVNLHTGSFCINRVLMKLSRTSEGKREWIFNWAKHNGGGNPTEGRNQSYESLLFSIFANIIWSFDKSMLQTLDKNEKIDARSYEVERRFCLIDL